MVKQLLIGRQQRNKQQHQTKRNTDAAVAIWALADNR